MRAQQYRGPGQLEVTITALELESAEPRDTGMGPTPFVEQVRGALPSTSDVKGRKIFSKTVMCSVPVSGWLHRPLLRDLRPRLRAGGGRRVPAARDHVSARLLRGHAGRRRGVPRVPLPPHHAQQPVHQGLLPGRGQPGGCPGHACPGHVSRVTQVTCRCPPGYTGRRCGECDAGFIGNPTLTGGACTRGECQCIVHLHLHIICCCLNIATQPTTVVSCVCVWGCSAEHIVVCWARV